MTGRSLCHGQRRPTAFRFRNSSAVPLPPKVRAGCSLPQWSKEISERRFATKRLQARQSMLCRRQRRVAGALCYPPVRSGASTGSRRGSSMHRIGVGLMVAVSLTIVSIAGAGIATGSDWGEMTAHAAAGDGCRRAGPWLPCWRGRSAGRWRRVSGDAVVAQPVLRPSGLDRLHRAILLPRSMTGTGGGC